MEQELPGGTLFTDPHVLECYSDDFTEEDPRTPAAVAIPKSMDDLRTIVSLAGQEGVVVVPRCAGSNVGGLTIPPEEPGLVVDLSLLSEIESINEADMIAVIQPGVTWMKLSRTIQELDPPLSFSYPLAPLHASVMAGCTVDGLGSLSLRHGTMSEMIGGMEVLLPDGQTVQTGMAAVFRDRPDRWLSRAPLPDMGGLFVGWQGTTGIVTRMSVQLWKMPPHRERYFILFDRLDEGFETITGLSGRFGLCDDLAGITWPASRFLFNVYGLFPRDRGEAEFFAYVDLGGFSREELEWKQLELSRMLGTDRGARPGVSVLKIGDLVRIAPSLAVFAKQPTTLSFLIAHDFGGMTWVGAYGPLSTFTESARSCMAVMESFGQLPTLVSRPMKGGHFDKKDREQRLKIRTMNEAMAESLLEHGFVPYKPPPWAWKKLRARMTESTLGLMDRMRKAADPSGIMNRGKLVL
jgi:FAD/FMN-containing dehydrogenase